MIFGVLQDIRRELGISLFGEKTQEDTELPKVLLYDKTHNHRTFFFCQSLTFNFHVFAMQIKKACEKCQHPELVYTTRQVSPCFSSSQCQRMYSSRGFLYCRQDQQTKDKQHIILAPIVDIDSLKAEIITLSSMRFDLRRITSFVSYIYVTKMFCHHYDIMY